ncbi:MAG: 30S ribosomal protein S20 [Rhodospirillaceae bacterium]|nr:30S ribosomal protein S20 [Rhodospirillaceae bacterium]|tara:strand:+ start:3141 stop:3404 length:264 start_codon:yes stop_codon:yes gene_type:complete
MANSISARKRVRQTEKRAAQNRDRRSRIRTVVKDVELAIVKGNRAEAEVAFKAMEPELMRGVTKGILKKNTASRKVSRLSTQVNSLK